MMMFAVADKEFKSKSECAKYTKSILDKTPNDSFVTKDECVFLLGLLETHPEHDSKVRSSLSGIKKIKVPPYSSYGFALVYDDGECIDFSYRKCLSGANHDADVMKALRQIIIPDMQQFAEINLGVSVMCPVTNEPISKDNYHVHHKEPKTFKKIVDDWLQERGLTLMNIELADTKLAFYSLKDKELASSFWQHHFNECDLIMLSQSGHVATHKGGK